MLNIRSVKLVFRTLTGCPVEPEERGHFLTMIEKSKHRMNEDDIAIVKASLEEFAKKFLASSGLRVLAFWDNGFRHFTNGVRAIHSPADCAGLSIRSMNSELHQEFFRSLGFEPTFVDVRGSRTATWCNPAASKPPICRRWSKMAN